MGRNIKTVDDSWWGGTQPFFLHPILSHLTPPILDKKKVLDLGSGKGTNGFLLRTTRDLKGSTLIALDIDPNFIRFIKKHRIYDKVVRAKLPDIPLSDKSVDFVMCTEVIEHLTKRNGLRLLSEIDRVCKGRSLISTPNVYFKPLRNKDKDAHNSTWSSLDFKKTGYRVYGVGFKIPLLLGSRFLNAKRALYYFATPFSYFLPQLGGTLVCVKDF